MNRYFSLTLFWFVLALASACSGSFDPYDKLTSFRVLALRAERPEIFPTETATLTALTYVPSGSTTASTSYHWTWCPLRGSVAQSFACLVTPAQVAAMGGGLPSFELGRTATITYTYPVPLAELQKICAFLSNQAVPTSVTLPQCTRSFPISIQLDIERMGQKITAIKQLDLHLSPTRTATVVGNQSPAINGVSIQLASETSTQTLMPTNSSTLAVLKRNAVYRLVLAIAPGSSETYIQAGQSMQETLAVTWFFEAGSMDKSRTGFIAGEESLAVAATNLWTTPRLGDFPSKTTRLFFVIRDNRDGVGWFERDFALEE